MPGRASGRILHIDDLAAGRADDDTEKIVLVARFSVPEIYSWAPRLAAVVAVNGSRLCHLAILLRGNEPEPIPYVYGIADIGSIPRNAWGNVVVGSLSGYLEPVLDGPNT